MTYGTGVDAGSILWVSVVTLSFLDICIVEQVLVMKHHAVVAKALGTELLIITAHQSHHTELLEWKYDNHKIFLPNSHRKCSRSSRV